jgi:hypothetical protein
MIWFLMACADPPLLDEVAGAYGDSVVEESATGIGLFVSVAAVIAEPCAADTVDSYTLTGEGYRAFRVTTPQIELGDGTRTYSFGTVVFGDDAGELTLTSDDNRKAWTARWGGQNGTLTANYSTSACDPGEEGMPAALVSLAGTGSYTRADGTEEDLTVTGGDAAVLSWAPATAPVPTGGTVTWHVTTEKVQVALDDASEIDGVSRIWPGKASGSGWDAEVDVTLP